jgi:hypothetical protein
VHSFNVCNLFMWMSEVVIVITEESAALKRDQQAVILSNTIFLFLLQENAIVLTPQIES